jgi:hypothetical protein
MRLQPVIALFSAAYMTWVTMKVFLPRCFQDIAACWISIGSVFISEAVYIVQKDNKKSVANFLRGRCQEDQLRCTILQAVEPTSEIWKVTINFHQTLLCYDIKNRYFCDACKHSHSTATCRRRLEDQKFEKRIAQRWCENPDRLHGIRETLAEGWQDSTTSKNEHQQKPEFERHGVFSENRMREGLYPLLGFKN